jgi:beta-galactosidase
VVLAPTAYLLTDDALANLQNYVAAGGTLVLGPFSGVADHNGHVRRGRFPVGLTDVIGASGEQWLPLPDTSEVMITSDLLADGPARVWSEQLRAEGAEVIATFAGWPVDGLPAVLRNAYQQGTAWYLATVPDDDRLGRLITTVIDDAGLRPVLAGLPDRVEAVRRGELLFVINHNIDDVVVTTPGRWRDLLTDTLVDDQLRLPGEDVAVLEPIEGGAE